MIMKPTLTFVLLMISLLIPHASCSSSIRETHLIKNGNELIGKIEEFRKNKGRIPDSLSEIGVEPKEEGPIYYEKINNAKYKLWFGTVLGESVTYDSDEKSWKRP
jgi:hypothetical protein